MVKFIFSRSNSDIMGKSVVALNILCSCLFLIISYFAECTLTLNVSIINSSRWLTLKKLEPRSFSNTQFIQFSKFVLRTLFQENSSNAFGNTIVMGVQSSIIVFRIQVYRCEPFRAQFTFSGQLVNSMSPDNNSMLSRSWWISFEKTVCKDHQREWICEIISLSDSTVSISKEIWSKKRCEASRTSWGVTIPFMMVSRTNICN